MVLPLLLLAACGNSPPPPSPPVIVTVQTTKVKRQPISEILTSRWHRCIRLTKPSLSPKITAPVRAFLRKPGRSCPSRTILAVLENRDLAAAATAAEGAFDNAQANYTKTTATTLPEQLQTAELNVQNAQANLDAQQKLYDSNLWLYQQHAGARKQVDQRWSRSQRQKANI